MHAGGLAVYAYHNCELAECVRLLGVPAPSADQYALLIRAYCELDDGPAAVHASERALAAHPQDGLLHYLHGMALYLADQPIPAIEVAFKESLKLEHPGGFMGLGFLSLVSGDPEGAVRLIESARASDFELEHIRRLMLFQIHATANDLVRAEQELKAADQILTNNPSLLRFHWGQLCWVRFLRSQGRFDGASAVLERLITQLDPQRTPRLYRNALEAQRLIEKRDDRANIRLPHPPPPPAINRRPMLNSLFQFLAHKGAEGASKEEIVEKVWDEAYNPLIHDDRLYKAIGRLRELIGDDRKAPSRLIQRGKVYVLSWTK